MRRLLKKNLNYQNLRMKCILIYIDKHNNLFESASIHIFDHPHIIVLKRLTELLKTTRNRFRKLSLNDPLERNDYMIEYYFQE